MESYRRQAAVLKAIGHPVRLQIVDLLRAEPECVCHLSTALSKSQPYVSQQLAILRHAGVIIDERDGTNIFYRLADDNVARQVTAACRDCDDPDSNRNGDEQAGRMLADCNCPKCLVARGLDAEAHRVKC
jgi:DNA-binding transcriptional ArsR family regulator